MVQTGLILLCPLRTRPSEQNWLQLHHVPSPNLCVLNLAWSYSVLVAIRGDLRRMTLYTTHRPHGLRRQRQWRDHQQL